MAKQGEREEQRQQNWRKEVDQNIKRLQSLLFGADSAIENRDFRSSQLLSLRLIGFLDARSQNDVDEAFVQPIRREALSKLDTSRRALAPDSDRQAFEAAGRDPVKVFSMNVDIDRIKQSQYFRALLQQSKKENVVGLAGQEDGKGKMIRKTFKHTGDTDLSSWHGNNMKGRHNILEKSSPLSKNSGLGDCIFLEKTRAGNNRPKGHFTSAHSEEERILGNNQGVKRQYMETRSPRNDCAKSPLNNEENNGEVSRNGFVTARAKLEMDAKQKRGFGGPSSASVSPLSDYNSNSRVYGAKSYGLSRRGVRGNFVPPIRSNGSNTGNLTARIGGKSDDSMDDSTKRCLDMLCGPDGELPEKS